MAYDSTKKRLYVSDDKGISTSEVAVCLGDYRVTSRGRDIGLLCTSPKINPWAKNKPTPYHLSGKPYVKPLTYDQRQAANFGLAIPTGVNPRKIRENYYDVAESPRRNGWVHNVPNPGNLDYFRLRDFDGYYHNSPVPFGKVSVPITAINTEGSTFFAQMTIRASGLITDEAIAPSELPAIADKYFAIQIRQQGGTTVRTTTAKNTLKDGDGSVEMGTFNLPVGYYDVIPFISPDKYEDNDGEILTREYHPLPLGEVSVIRILEKWYSVTLAAYKTSSSSGQPAIAYSFVVENHSAGTISFSNSYVIAKKRSSAFGDALLDGEKQSLLLAFDVAAYSTYEYAETLITGISQEVYNDPQLWFSFKDGDMVKSIIPLASAEQTNE